MRHRFFNPELARMAAIAERYGSTQGYVDAQNLYSDAQAVTTTAVSTNIIDHSQDRNLGIGTPLIVVCTVDVAMGGTTGTLIVTLQADDNSGFSSAATVAVSQTYAQATLVAGYQIILPVPPDLMIERFSRLNYTTGGTSPTITLTSFLTLQSMQQNAVTYAAGVTPLT